MLIRQNIMSLGGENMRNTIEIVGIKVDNVNYVEAEKRVDEYLEGDKLNMIFTPNGEILLNAVKDREFGDLLNEAQLVIPDGIGVVIASKFYGTPLKERVTGVDLTNRILAIAAGKGSKVYILGAAKEVVTAAADKIKEQYEGINIVGIRDGYFSEDEETEIIEDINIKEADILLVALGVPKQEFFIYNHRNELKVKLAISIGGSLDVISGRLKRAPEFYQRMGLEWLYRLIQEPSRLKRIMALPKFILLALYDSISTKH